MERPTLKPEWFEVKDDDAANGRWYGRAALKHLRHDEKVKDIRDAESYSKADNLKALRESLQSDTEQGPAVLNPMHTYFDEKEGVLRVLGGNRRLAALNELANNKDVVDVTETSLVPVYVYYGDISPKEIFRKAMMDNVLRKNLEGQEIMRAVRSMKANRFSDEEVMTTLGIEKTKLDRFLAILDAPVLLEFFKEEHLPYSTLAQLAQACTGKDSEGKEKDRAKLMAGLESMLRAWLIRAKDAREERRLEKAAKNKSLSTAETQLSSYLKPVELQGWLLDLKAGKVPSGNRAVRVISVEIDEKKVAISALRADPREMTLEELIDNGIILKNAVEQIRAIARLKEAKNLQQATSGQISAEARKAWLTDAVSSGE